MPDEIGRKLSRSMHVRCILLLYFSFDGVKSSLPTLRRPAGRSEIAAISAELCQSAAIVHPEVEENLSRAVGPKEITKHRDNGHQTTLIPAPQPHYPIFHGAARCNCTQRRMAWAGVLVRRPFRTFHRVAKRRLQLVHAATCGGIGRR